MLHGRVDRSMPGSAAFTVALKEAIGVVREGIGHSLVAVPGVVFVAGYPAISTIHFAVAPKIVDTPRLNFSGMNHSQDQ